MKLAVFPNIVLFSGLLLCGNAVEAQVMNFDVPGGAGNGAENFSGQGAVPDPGNNYWNPFVLDGATPAGTYSDGVSPSPITLTDTSIGVSFGLSGGSPGTPGALEWPWAYGYSAVTNTINHVPAGTYNLYLIGKTADTGYPGGALFDVFVDGTDYGTQYTVNTATSSFVEGNDYVVFTNVIVGTDGVIAFTYAPPPERPSEGDWNGLQLVPANYKPKPGGLAVVPGSTQVALTWIGSPGATSYNVKRSTTSGSEVTVANVSGTSYTDTGLNNGTTYYYVVSGITTGGESGNSSEISVAPVQALAIVNFDVPGGAGGVNYSGQGAYPDVGDNYWNPWVMNGTTVAGNASDGMTSTPITLSDNVYANANLSTSVTSGTQGTPSGLENPYAIIGGYYYDTSTLNHVPPGTYDIFFYGTDGSDGTWFDAFVDNTTYYPQLSTYNVPDSNFLGGDDYVEFSNVVVGTNGTIIFNYWANGQVERQPKRNI